MTRRNPRVAATTTATAGDLLDVNVWLALAIEEHPHHRVATSYWAESAEAVRFFCRLSAMSLVRLLMHPKLMADRPLPLPKAWGLYRSFAALPGVAMLQEPEQLDTDLGAFVARKLPARLFTDAYFAALAGLAQVRLVTFDRDFERFDRVSVLRLPVADIA
jgi:toxin-antitoxin system PIN domain toxin